MDELARFFAMERSLLARTSTRSETIDAGVVYMDEEHPERYYSSFLLADDGMSDVSAEGLAGSAERVLGGTDARHRMVVIRDPAVAERLAPRFATLGYRASWSVVMSHRHAPDRAGDVAVREVPFAKVRPLIREMYLEDPDVPDEGADGFTEQQGKRERTVGARYYVGSVERQLAGVCELDVDGHDAQVENVGTLVRFRGRGVARSVVLRAVDAARASGADRVFIVADEDDWPKALYARLGFGTIGRTCDFLRAPEN